ncbi:hypothetical protein BU14_0433s0002 [Porphyra umbilicalis]|uniref:Uncharacterized protein n=1 Tax=Porphyra umbilicalis TaxID=2786 RepID=A0A1X6NUY5_PORUM|nr:hypothetical protein BU14_0433s0002 [Porphyra umbilicalis]|eukprot:OSX72444.1 hypothetical protein BU14_0433s0002 [Porphyra umbilicalis]
MSRAAVNRMAGPMLVFLGLSTIGASAMLVPILSARRAGGSVQRGPLADGAVDDGATMAHLRGLAIQQQQQDVDQRRGVEGVASPTGAVPALPPPRS